MSLNIGSNQISPIQINNVINNQSNKNVIPSKSQQIIKSDTVYKLCENLTDALLKSEAGTSISYYFSSFSDSWSIFPTLYARVNGSVTVSTLDMPDSFTIIFTNAILSQTNTHYGRGFVIYPNSTSLPSTITFSGQINNWTNSYIRDFSIDLHDRYGIFVGFSFDGQERSRHIILQNLTIELSDDPTFSSNYDGMNQVTVEPIPSDYIIPEGTLSVLNSGTFDAKSYANVNVPGMTTSPWTTTTITSSTGKVNYNINLSSGFRSTSLTFSSSITLPSVTGITITPSNTSQIAVDAYKWTKSSIIVDAIPSSITIYQKIINKTVTIDELNNFLSSQTIVPSFAFMVSPRLSGALNLGGVISVYSSAFSNCVYITEINGPNVSFIDYYAFGNCSRVTAVSFPNLTEIWQGGLNHTGITSLYLPELISTRQPFSYLSYLETVDLPKVSIMLDYFFCYDSRLVSVNLPNVTTISGYGAFSQCYALTNVSLPKLSLLSGTYYLFSSCSSLVTLSFPMLQKISGGSKLFYNCSNFKSLYLMSTSVVTLTTSSGFDNSPFVDNTLNGEYASIFVPNTLLNDYKIASNWSYLSDRFVGV